MSAKCDPLQAEQEVADRYRAAGYQVTRQPTRELLPPSIVAYTPDLLAVRGSEKVAVEVKTDRNFDSDDQLVQVAEQFRRVPGWRLDLVVLKASDETAEPPRLLSKQDRLDRITIADRIAQEGKDFPAALLLLWTVFESILRELIEDDERRILSPQRLAKEAFSLGLISEEEWMIVDHSTDARNQAVHGEMPISITRDEYDRFRNVVDRLLTLSVG